MTNFLIDEATTDDENIKYKYPWIVAEILSSDSGIVDSFLEQKEQYDKLCNYLFSSSPRNSSNFLTNYVCKVMGFLLVKSSSTVIESIKLKEELIGQLFNNIENSSILEFLLKFIACDITEHNYGVSEWLLKVKLFDSMIEKFTPEYNYNTHENVTQLISSIVALSLQVSVSPMLGYLKEEKVIARILEILQQNENSDKKSTETYYSALKFGIICVMEIIKLYSNNHSPFDNSPFNAIPLPLQTCLQPIDFYISVLQNNNGNAQMDTTFGRIAPLGSHRLQVIELVQTLCASRYTSLYQYCFEKQLFQAVFKIFFEYPWNNILHITVFQMIQAILDTTNEELISTFLQSTQFHIRLANIGSTAVDEGNNRLGIMGTFSKVATLFQNINFPVVREILDNSPEWCDYISGEYSETRKKETAPFGSSSLEDEEVDSGTNEELKLFTARTKKNYEITFPVDFAVGDFDDADTEIYFLPKDEKQYQGICTDEDGMDIFDKFV